MQTIEEIHKEFDELFSEQLLEVNLAYEEDYQKLWNWIEPKLKVSRVDAVVKPDFGGEIKNAFWDGNVAGRLMELKHLKIMIADKPITLEILESEIKKWLSTQNSV